MRIMWHYLRERFGLKGNSVFEGGLVSRVLPVSSLLSSSSLSLSSPSDTKASSSSSVLFFGSHVILFSFFNRLRALANHVDTWVRVILVIIASMIFSPLVG